MLNNKDERELCYVVKIDAIAEVVDQYCMDRRPPHIK